MDRTLGPSIAILLAVLGFFEVTGMDLWVQDRMYDFTSHTWLLDAKAGLPRLLFYTGPKGLIWFLGLGLLVLALAPTGWRERLPSGSFKRRDLWIVVGTLVIAPSLIAMAKVTTNVHTPAEIRRYEGSAPYVKVFEAYPAGDRPSKRGRGFPAGHASGGFALMALGGLASTSRRRLLGIGCGLAMGTLMGCYQILKGAHYLSHTLVTALVCWVVFLALRRVAMVWPQSFRKFS